MQSSLVSTSNAFSASDIEKAFHNIMKLNPELSAPVAAIQALLEVIRHSKATTMSEFMQTIKEASEVLKSTSEHPISVMAGCDLFLRFLTVSSHEAEFETCKEILLKSGNMVVQKASTQKQKIVKYSQDFIRDGSVILVHSYSRVVMGILECAAKQNKRFRVFCTESRPSMGGLRVYEALKKLGVPCELILDSAVGYNIERINMVLVGAEGIVENGGLINSVGTYQIAMIAKAARIPLYCAAESFKFVRLYPLNQYDLPYVRRHDENVEHKDKFSDIDYTPPQYITLLWTDLGVLTPSGVSDELIKLYY